MKTFLSTLKGKIILAASTATVIVAAAITIVVVKSPELYRSIKVEELNGTTTIVKGQSDEEIAYKGMNLKSGDEVTVEADSNMTLLFDADKYMFADAGTKFKVEASGNSEKSNTKTRIILEEGSVLCRIDKKLGDNETYEVETPNSVMSVRGTIFKLTIYKDKNGENYAKVDVLEGTVKVDLYMENGEKAGKEGLIEAGQAALVHSNTDISEFVVGESDISYDDFSDAMAEFVVNTVDNGREICIGENLFKHYTGYETHPEEEIIVKEPTATEDGLKEIYCPTCDEVIRTEAIPATGEEEPEGEPEEPVVEPEEIVEPAEPETTTPPPVTQVHNHTFGDWVETTAATCEADGVETSTCEGCGATQTQSIVALGHSYGSWVETTAATCEVAGESTRTCSRNGCTSKETQSIAALGHSYGSWVETTAATCEVAGESTRTCTNSGCTLTQTQPITPIGHSYGSWVETTAATCEVAGENTRTCSRNGCTSKETQSIAALGHSYGSWAETAAATCLVAGVKMQTCGNCQGTRTEEIAALGHSYGAWVETTAPTCLVAGENTRTCTRSGCTAKETQAVAAKGHSVIYTHDGATSLSDTTFTVTYTGICDTCDEIISEEEHTGTYTEYISPTDLNAKCSCGYEFVFSY